MASRMDIGALLPFAFTFHGISASALNREKTPIYVRVGGHCLPGAAPVGPNGSWQIVESNVTKICVAGTTCRFGACNCDNLTDGTVTGISRDYKDDWTCRRVAGQRCAKSEECFRDVSCVNGVCTCDESKPDFYCVDSKNDVFILS